MANKFSLPKERVLPANTMPREVMEQFVKSAPVVTNDAEPAIVRKTISTQMDIRLIEALDDLSKTLRINKRILFEEAVATYIESQRNKQA